MGPVVRRLEDEATLYAENPGQIEKIRRITGVNTRHVAPCGVTTLDLCQQASQRLLRECEVGPEQLNAVICVTQTPDYWQPCNANLLHGRLGLPKTSAAFDINQGCSGWVYGLYVAGCMLEAGACERILLVAGDTVTQSINPKDRAVVPLFGDAGTATLLEKSESAGPAWFSLCSDGKGWANILIPAGGYRRPRSADTGIERVADDGGSRSANDLHMNGIEVFNFTLREEPTAVRDLLRFASQDAEKVDAFVFHQANKLILDTLAMRLRLPHEKVPVSTLARYGNQSSASVPATLCDALAGDLLKKRLKVLCSAFGVGLSWASCLLEIGPLKVCGTESFASTDGSEAHGGNVASAAARPVTAGGVRPNA